MKDDQRYVFGFLDQLVYSDQKAIRRGVHSTLDVSARPVIVSHINDAVVFIGHFLAFDYRSKILAQGVSGDSFRPVKVLTSGVMY